jgi:hypothetical protein
MVGVFFFSHVLHFDISAQSGSGCYHKMRQQTCSFFFFSLPLWIHPTTKPVFALPIISFHPTPHFSFWPTGVPRWASTQTRSSRLHSVNGRSSLCYRPGQLLHFSHADTKDALPVGRNILPIESSGRTVHPYPYLDAQYAIEAHHSSTNRRLVHCSLLPVIVICHSSSSPVNMPKSHPTRIYYYDDDDDDDDDEYSSPSSDRSSPSPSIGHLGSFGRPQRSSLGRLEQELGRFNSSHSPSADLIRISCPLSLSSSVARKSSGRLGTQPFSSGC